MNVNLSIEKKYWEQIKEPIVDDTRSLFTITIQNGLPLTLSIKSIQELVSKLLFDSISWIRSNSVFKLCDQLSQTILLQKHWIELFILGLAQCSNTLCVNSILATLKNYYSKEFNDLIDEQLIKIQNIINDCELLQLNDKEYAYLKIISVLDQNCLNVYQQMNLDKLNFSIYKDVVQAMQIKAMKELKELVSKSNDTERFSRLIICLPSLRGLSMPIVEKLFFSEILSKLKNGFELSLVYIEFFLKFF